MRFIRTFACAALALAAVAAAYAQSAPAPVYLYPVPSGAGPHLREDIRQHYFAERKEQVLRLLGERISIVATAQACVSASTAIDQLRACMQQERAAMEQIRPEGGR
jgi:hypothetical protein